MTLRQSACVLLFGLMLANTARADLGSVNLQMNGTIVAQGCDISSDSTDQTVHIGDFSKSIFTTSSVSPAANFDIKLVGCSANVSGATIRFSGQPDRERADLLSLSASSGGSESDLAQGVAVQILDALTSKPIELNRRSTVYALVTGDNTLQYQLRYKTTGSAIVAGNATAVMYFDLVYQ